MFADIPEDRRVAEHYSEAPTPLNRVHSLSLVGQSWEDAGQSLLTSVRWRLQCVSQKDAVRDRPGEDGTRWLSLNASLR